MDILWTFCKAQLVQIYGHFMKPRLCQFMDILRTLYEAHLYHFIEFMCSS